VRLVSPSVGPVHNKCAGERRQGRKPASQVFSRSAAGCGAAAAERRAINPSVRSQAKCYIRTPTSRLSAVDNDGAENAARAAGESLAICFGGVDRATSMTGR